ncbi:MAG: hypothetical protein IJH64_11255 [Oscillospiraceae bacterium]|nr:hypothetical protein [Oscillospiraceae bacterium]
MDNSISSPENIKNSEQEPAGYYMEYPTLEEAKYYTREMDFEDRLTVLSQGFHRGITYVRCYSLEQFVYAIGKREFNNPAGGVRTLDFDELYSWIKDKIGDEILANAVQKICRDCDDIMEAIDVLRVVVYIRMNQYKEVMAT